ncbi:hypothetical protein K488DRAFT_87233, partial [Vararia minispora EC-137]
MTSSPAPLLRLPPEILEHLFLLLPSPCILSPLAQTCHHLRSAIYSPPDTHLWRTLFLRTLDDPRTCLTPLGLPLAPHAAQIDWQTRLTAALRASSIARSPKLCQPHERTRTLETLVMLARNLPPRPRQSKNVAFLNEALDGPGLLEWEEGWEPGEQERQMRARLRVIVGLERGFGANQLIAARARVYDMDRYSRRNAYGPFFVQPDHKPRRVDWEQIRAVHHAVAVYVGGREGGPHPLSSAFAQLRGAEETEVDKEKEGEVEDWAGVGGRWRMLFSFMDHRALMHFNHTRPLDTALLVSPHFFEASRAIGF